MSAIHQVIGYAVVGVFALGWLWGLGAWISRRGPGERYWLWLTVAQVVAGAQALLGIVLLLMGRRMATPGALGDVLHYVYGLGGRSCCSSSRTSRAPGTPGRSASTVRSGRGSPSRGSRSSASG